MKCIRYWRVGGSFLWIIDCVIIVEEGGILVIIVEVVVVLIVKGDII